MASAPSPSLDAALTLAQPLFERLERQPGARLRCFLADVSAGNGGSDDVRLDAQLALMRQALAREQSAEPGALFQNWSDLHNHLRFAVVPVGRVLLMLHSEAEIAQPPIDALMLATGLTAILQQAPRRFRDDGRILLPVQWFPAGTDIGFWLRGRERSAALDTAYANGLARLNELLAAAERGMAALHDANLRRGAQAMLFLLRRLQARLTRRTPNVAPAQTTLLDRLLLRWRF